MAEKFWFVVGAGAILVLAVSMVVIAALPRPSASLASAYPLTPTEPSLTSTPTSASTPTSTRTPTPTSAPEPLVRALQRLNLRSGPGLVYPIVGKIEQAEEVKVIGRYGSWYLLEDGSWVYGGEEYVEADHRAMAVPTVEERDIPPTPTPTASPTPTPTPTPTWPNYSKGALYEVIDLSNQYDLYVVRPGLDDFLRVRYGAKLPSLGVRITLMDRTSENSDGPYNVYAPIPLVDFNVSSNPREPWALSKAWGEDGLVWADCDTGLYNPHQCFIVIDDNPRRLDDTLTFAWAFAMWSTIELRTFYDWDDQSLHPYTVLGNWVKEGERWGYQQGTTIFRVEPQP